MYVTYMREEFLERTCKVIARRDSMKRRAYEKNVD